MYINYTSIYIFLPSVCVPYSALSITSHFQLCFQNPAYCRRPHMHSSTKTRSQRQHSLVALQPTLWLPHTVGLSKQLSGVWSVDLWQARASLIVLSQLGVSVANFCAASYKRSSARFLKCHPCLDCEQTQQYKTWVGRKAWGLLIMPKQKFWDRYTDKRVAVTINYLNFQ